MYKLRVDDFVEKIVAGKMITPARVYVQFHKCYRPPYGF